MAVAQGYGKTVTSGSVFAYDTGDTRNSYIGQPTTNIGNNFRDFTGTGYSPDGEWTSNPTSFTKTYYPNLITPIGPGGTLIEESGTGGYHHLSGYGGGGESGAHSLSCYIYPLVSGITDFCIGMLGDSGNNIQFNLDTRVITYGGGISNRNAFIKDVPGYPGWLRVGANIEGRGGGWVGCFGYSSYTSYTGTAGAKKAYITGIQYEYITQPTAFVAGTRSATQGLLPLVGNSTIDLSNVSFDSNAQMTFDGTNDYFSSGYDLSWNNSNSVSIEFIIKRSGTGGGFLGKEYPNWEWSFYLDTAAIQLVYWTTAGGHANGMDHSTSQFMTSTSNYYHVIYTWNGSVSRWYVNSALDTIHTATDPSLNQNRSNNVMVGGHTYVWADSFAAVQLPVLKFYNRALSAAEIKQNYLHYKTRFNLS